MARLRALGISAICFLWLFCGGWSSVAGLDKFKSCEGQPAELEEYAEYLSTVVTTAALPFWYATVQKDRGGYDIVPGARHIIEQARIIWTFSNAESRGFRSPGINNAYAAQKGVDFLESHFLDTELGGYYWSTDADGVVTDDRKYLQGQLTTLAALSKYYSITYDHRARRMAFALLDVIQEKARDAADGGWYEHFTRDWIPLTEGEGPIGTQGRKTIGAVIIFVQSLTDLLNATGDESVATLLTEIIQNEVPKFITPEPENAIMELTLNETVVSTAGNEAGAPIETVWLTLDGQIALGTDPDWDLFDKYMAFGEANRVPGTGGIIADGGLVWWGQAEFLSAFSFTISRRGPLETTSTLKELLDLIVCSFVNVDDGIWFDEVDSEGNVIDSREAYEWKVGFHETRAMTAFAST